MPDTYFVDVVDATNRTLCGGKASGLAHLERAGFAVPAAICLTTEFYRRWLQGSGISPRLTEMIGDSAALTPAARREILRDMRRRIEAASMPDDLAAVLREQIADLRADWAGALSVRSSAVHEDHEGASHAGIHASFVVAGLDARPVIAAIKRCLASLWTERAWTVR